jgi:hypothetical protein
MALNSRSLPDVLPAYPTKPNPTLPLLASRTGPAVPLSNLVPPYQAAPTLIHHFSLPLTLDRLP